MKHEDRPTEMLERQLLANRQAARDRRHFAHLPMFRAAFVRDTLALRRALRQRRNKPGTL